MLQLVYKHSDCKKKIKKEKEENFKTMLDFPFPQI